MRWRMKRKMDDVPGLQYGGSCLRCREPIELDTASVFVECPACGFRNSRLDRQTYWTLEPRFVWAERIAKVLVMAGTLAAVVYMIHTLRFRGRNGGILIAPLLLGMGLWLTASKFTQWEPYFSARIFWTSALVLIAIPLSGYGWHVSIGALFGAASIWFLTTGLAAWRKRYAAGR